MAFVGTVRILATVDVQNQLASVAPAVARKYLRQALRAGAVPIREEAQRRAPVKTGALRKSIKIRMGKAKKKWAARVLVQTRDGDFTGKEFYGMIIHQGTVERTQKKTGRNVGKVDPMPYMQEAFDARKDEAEAIIARELEAGILQEFKR